MVKRRRAMDLLAQHRSRGLSGMRREASDLQTAHGSVTGRIALAARAAGAWRALLAAPLVSLAPGAVNSNTGPAYASGPQPTAPRVKPTNGPPTGRTLDHIRGRNLTRRPAG